LLLLFFLLFHFPESTSGAVPSGWDAAPYDREWMGQHVFSAKGRGGSASFWFQPPAIGRSDGANLGQYFRRRLFLWQPRSAYGYNFKCTAKKKSYSGSKQQPCGLPLTGKGIYRTLRKVIDIDEVYHLGTEYYQCSDKKGCNATYPAWASSILLQLPIGIRSQFPALLTYRHAVDKKVVNMLRSRTLGNSPTVLQQQIASQHFTTHLTKSYQYLEAVDRINKRSVCPVEVEVLPDPPKIPGAKFFLNVHTRDVLMRMDVLKAQLTSVTGVVLKMDSTRKTAKKLAGQSDLL
jgi:hypothetical protein